MTKKTANSVKFLDVQKQNKVLKKELLSAIGHVIDSSQFIMGPEVSALEKEIAKFSKVKHAIAVNSGTDALVIALKALDIGKGDEVLVPDFTFVATATAVLLAGATPVLVDVEPETFMMDMEAAQAKLTKKTKAIIPVHLYGQAMNMTAVMQFAKQAKLKVVEDTAQAIGATWNRQAAGTFGDFGCLSFFPTKNFGAIGDGGMLLTNDDKLASRAGRLRQHGADRKYFHDELGYNSRLDSVQAVALRVKLPYLKFWNKRRQSIAKAYSDSLKDIVQVPLIQKGATHVFHQYAILTAGRDRLQQHLAKQGAGSAVHYPLPLHKQPVLAHTASAKKKYPVSEALCQDVLCLPIAPEVSDDGVRRVIKGIHEFING